MTATSRLVAAAALGASLFLVSPPAPAQVAVTLLARPQDATIGLRGPSDIIGISPLELGPEWTGKFTVVVQAPGHAAAEGTVYLPGPGGVPRRLSDPPGLSGGLLLKSLDFPGAAALLGHRPLRGAALMTAGVGGLGAVVRDQIEYSGKKDDPGFEGKRALDFKYARDRWILYTGGVWLLSAMDNIVRPRLDVVEASTTKATLVTPEISRSGLIWRSILVPGAGQDCAGKNVRGAAWLGATLLSGAAYVTAAESHHRIQTKLAEANELLLGATTPAEQADFQVDVDHFTKKENDSKKLMDNLALTTLVIYAANVVDAGLVGLGENSGLAKVSLAPSIGARRAGVSVRIRY